MTRTNDFLCAIKEIEEILLSMQFKPYSFDEKGHANYIQYKKEGIILQYLFGPSDWDVEMIIYTAKGKFAFKDLLQMPNIKNWVDENRYVQNGSRNVKGELLWYLELLKISLPMIE